MGICHGGFNADQENGKRKKWRDATIAKKRIVTEIAFRGENGAKRPRRKPREFS